MKYAQASLIYLVILGALVPWWQESGLQTRSKAEFDAWLGSLSDEELEAFVGHDEELWLENSDRLRSLIPKALDVLKDELEGDDRLRAAAMILKFAGLGSLPAPVGRTDAEDIQIERAKKASQRVFDSVLAGR